MSLIRFEDVSLDFGEQKILTGADLAIEPGERICLIGRNGAGKSTTFKLITGELEPDRGELVPTSGLVVSQLAQTIPDSMDMAVSDVVRSGLAEIELLLKEYARRSRMSSTRRACANLKSFTGRSTHTAAGIYSNVSMP